MGKKVNEKYESLDNNHNNGKGNKNNTLLIDITIISMTLMRLVRWGFRQREPQQRLLSAQVTRTRHEKIHVNLKPCMFCFVCLCLIFGCIYDAADSQVPISPLIPKTEICIFLKNFISILIEFYAYCCIYF